MRNFLGDKLVLEQAEFAKIQGWHHDNHREAMESFLKSCAKMQTISDDKTLHKNGVGGKYGDWKKLCDEAQNSHFMDDTQIKHFFEKNFTPYLVTNWGKVDGRFTGYFETELKGSRTKQGQYQYPLYRLPDDIKKGKEYFTRAEIENGALAGRGLEIAWTDDPVRLFFLHIQGSGRLIMEDGSVMRVGYSGQNQNEYIAVGKIMIERGYIAKENMSAEAIKEWLYNNPDKMHEVMNTNPSYVFFREIEGGDGPIGAQGVALTPLRSIAVDKKFLPYGAPVWVNVDITQPEGGLEQNFRRLLIAQDTGGAIKGPVRGDLFFGYGSEAERMAGHQNSRGFYYILLPNGVKP